MPSFIKHRFLASVVIGTLIVALAIPKPEKMGDRLQYVLPIAGFVCSLDVKQAASVTTRYVAGFVSVHFLKNVLPSDGINMRPDGGSHGFPSGHTYAATFGASYIARQCASKIPYIGPIAALGAGFTGASRVDAQKHNPFQVFFGALFGLVFDRAFQSAESRSRRNALLKKLFNKFKFNTK